MTEEEKYRLAERLARAMGAELRFFPKANHIFLEVSDDGSRVGEWYGREGVLRGDGVFLGFLDIGHRWKCSPFVLPKGLSKDSTDEEIALILTALGF